MKYGFTMKRLLSFNNKWFYQSCIFILTNVSTDALIILNKN